MLLEHEEITIYQRLLDRVKLNLPEPLFRAV
jgi:hypothetical protein